MFDDIEFCRKYALRAQEIMRGSNHPLEPWERLVRRVEKMLAKRAEEKLASACP